MAGLPTFCEFFIFSVSALQLLYYKCYPTSLTPRTVILFIFILNFPIYEYFKEM